MRWRSLVLRPSVVLGSVVHSTLLSKLKPFRSESSSQASALRRLRRLRRDVLAPRRDGMPLRGALPHPVKSNSHTAHGTGWIIVERPPGIFNSLPMPTRALLPQMALVILIHLLEVGSWKLGRDGGRTEKEFRAIPASHPPFSGASEKHF